MITGGGSYLPATFIEHADLNAMVTRVVGWRGEAEAVLVTQGAGKMAVHGAEVRGTSRKQCQSAAELRHFPQRAVGGRKTYSELCCGAGLTFSGLPRQWMRNS